jgi:hypothetical protein
MTSELVEVTYTRSIAVAMEVMRLKSPMTVRSSGRQSRLGDCAAAGAVSRISTPIAKRITAM